jgi:hypothetical protein
MWPNDKVVARAFKGQITEMIHTPLGTCRGVRSSNPAVYLMMVQTPCAFCETCSAQETLPNPPSSGAPGDPQTPLVAPGTKAHALFILTWLHKFSAKHNAHADESETYCI